MRALGLAVALLAIAAWGVRAGEEDKGFLAGLISRALSSSATQVSIGAVEGALSSDATVRDVVLSDRDGPWLKIDHARLIWSRLALLQRRLDVESLEIGHIVWSRNARKDSAASGQMEWPDLPLKAIVKRFAVESLDLGAPILGAPARLGFTGSASLGRPAEGLDLAFAAKRLDAPGALDLKLSFVPQTRALTLALDAEEPQGGLLAGAAHLPGAPPLSFRLDGGGPLDAFDAKLAFAAGPEIGAQGDVSLTRQGGARRLKLDLAARLAGLMPGVAAPVFAGRTQLYGAVDIADDGAATTDGVTLESEAAALQVVGGVAADGLADLKLNAHAKPNASLARLEFAASARGALPRPDVDVSLVVDDLKSAAATLGHVQARFSARPAGDAMALTGEADLAGLALADPAQAALVGATGRLALKATATPEGALDVAEFRLETEALAANFAGKAARDALAGKLTAEAGDLSRLRALTGLDLKGSAHLEAALSGDPARANFAADVHALAAHFATNLPALDGFAGSGPALDGGVRIDGGAYGFDKLTLTGAGGGAVVDGALGSAGARLQASIRAPDAHKLDSRLEGAATAQATLAGPLAAPDIDAQASLQNGRLLGRPSQLSLTGQTRGGATLSLILKGDVGGKALDGGLTLARKDGGVALDRALLTLGKARIEGAGSFAQGIADGRLSVEAPDLDDLSPLALTPLSGGLSAQARLTPDQSRQNVAIRARSPQAALGPLRMSGLDVDMRLADLYGDVSANGEASAAKIVAAGETISGVKLGAKGDAFTLAATARGQSVSARGALRMAARTLRLDAFTATGRGPALALAGPSTLAFGPQGVETSGLVVKIGAGRASAQGRAGAKLDLTLKADAVPLAVANLAAPGLDLAGVASGEARLTGDAAAPAGDWRLALTGLTARAGRDAGLPPLDVKASGRLGAGRTSLEASVTAGAAGSLRLTGFAPLRRDNPLDLAVSGRLEMAPLTSVLATRGERASGALSVQARVTGDIAHPRAQGGASLAGAAFSDEISGLRLTEIGATLTAHDDVVDIVRAAAKTPGGGAVTASGRVRLAPGFPGDIHIGAEDARLVATDIVTAEAGLALDISGPLAATPRVAGRIDVKALDVEIPGRLPGSSAPLADVRHIDPGPAARAQLARRAHARSRAGAAFDATLSLAVSAPSRVTVHGRGVDAEFGGTLQVAGTSGAPKVSGGFDLRRGTLTLIGGPLTFSRGAVRFEGDTIPRLDLEARQTLSDATAIIDVTGRADAPVFVFSSSPDLPQDEILSRLLFQKPSGGLSAFQALQLANTVASLSGSGGALDSLRRTLGVDSLDVSSDANGGPVLGARRAIGDRLSLGVKSGARPQDNGVSLDLDVTKRLKLSTGVDAKGESNVGAGVQWEY